jgi:hypothetical protein
VARQRLAEPWNRAGVTVAILGKNFSRWFEILFGAHKVSAVIPVNWRLAALEIRCPLKDSES